MHTFILYRKSYIHLQLYLFLLMGYLFKALWWLCTNNCNLKVLVTYRST